MRKSTIALILVLNIFFSFGQDMNNKNLKVITNFIECIKSQNKESLSNMISFPLQREYPIPEIRNKQEFLKRYNEIFDDHLIKMILKSKPTKDWSVMGWHGLMLLDGQVWLDFNGKLIGVNYQTNFEERKLKELIDSDKNSLYESIKVFKLPICVLETSRYRIRIDILGNNKYRYASWSLKSKMSDKPDMIIQNGEFVPDGSGGNHSYVFKNANFVYECGIIEMGEDNSPPAYLTVSKGDKVILSQDAKIIIK